MFRYPHPVTPRAKPTAAPLTASTFLRRTKCKCLNGVGINDMEGRVRSCCSASVRRQHTVSRPGCHRACESFCRFQRAANDEFAATFQALAIRGIASDTMNGYTAELGRLARRVHQHPNAPERESLQDQFLHSARTSNSKCGPKRLPSAVRVLAKFKAVQCIVVRMDWKFMDAVADFNAAIKGNTQKFLGVNGQRQGLLCACSTPQDWEVAAPGQISVCHGLCAKEAVTLHYNEQVFYQTGPKERVGPCSEPAGPLGAKVRMFLRALHARWGFHPDQLAPWPTWAMIPSLVRDMVGMPGSGCSSPPQARGATGRRSSASSGVIHPSRGRLCLCADAAGIWIPEIRMGVPLDAGPGGGGVVMPSDHEAQEVGASEFPRNTLQFSLPWLPNQFSKGRSRVRSGCANWIGPTLNAA